VFGTDVIDLKIVKIEYGLQQDFRDLVAAAKELGTDQNSINYYLILILKRRVHFF
jgi:hypothetical protein